MYKGVKVMNKHEMAVRYAEIADISIRDALFHIDCFTTLVQEGLKEDGFVKLVGFGKWETRTKKAHRCLHPETKDWCYIPERKTVLFRAGNELKEDVKNE